MARGQGMGDSERPLYMISVAADLAGMHPQTLRIYERKLLIKPKRSQGNTRLYSDADIERLRLIQQLTAEGINLAGVVRIMELENETGRLRLENERVRSIAEEYRRQLIAERERSARPERTEIVVVRGGGLVRRRGGE